MATEILLLEDIDSLGRKGEIVRVKPGYSRNFLIPNKLAIVADKHTLRLQDRLKEERSKKAIVDKTEAEGVSSRLQDQTFTKIVKVDHDGHMYGSVTVADIIHLIQENAQVELDKKSIQIAHPIKKTGIHEIHLKLKEGVTASFSLKVMSEEDFRRSQEEPAQAEKADSSES